MLLLRLVLLLLLIVPSYTLAAKKKPKRTASTAKGFGASPPSYADVLAGFHTRLPDNLTVNCPCGSTRSYLNCCRPFHVGQSSCQSPTDVLRTRYTGFCFRLVDYILSTTHPTCRDYTADRIAWAKDLNKQGMFDSFEFVQLERGEQVIDGEQGWIDFRVRLRARQGAETVVRENSRFLRDDQGVWSYAGGEVTSEQVGLEDAILNQ